MQNTFTEQIDALFEAVDRRHASRNPLLAANCRQLRADTLVVIQYARQYDFRDVEANGFWTFARLVLRFASLATDSDDDNSLDAVSVVLLSGVSLCQQFASRDNKDLFASSPEEFVALLEVFKTLTPNLHVIYGTFCSYWLCHSMRRTMSGFTTLMAVFASDLRVLCDRKQKSEIVAQIAQNATVEFVKSFWGLTENRFFRHAIPRLRGGAKVSRDLFIERQKRFVVSSSEALILFNPEEYIPKRSSVRCRLLTQSLDSELSIVLHAHGGGFVSQSPDSHELYLGMWAQRLTGSAIISVDYSLSPENRYPIALQELLDVYLWLVSDAPHFRVKQIVICGDSAGGNLALALVLALQQIPVKAPKGVLCFYAPLMLQTRGSPSRLMTAVDTLLPLGVLLSCLEAYAPKDDDFELISMDDVPSVVVETSQPSLLSSLRRRFLRDAPPLKPWYRRESLNERLTALNIATNNAFVSPLLATCLPRDIPLYLIGLHFDACLDDSVQMAKKWPGPVLLDVLDHLPHGFLNFVVLSAEAERASDLCLDRIKQSLI